MATDKKSEKERSVEERLKSLYELQTIFSEIDRIKTLRGELPNEVKDLEDDIVRYQTRIQKYRDEITSLKKQIQQKTARYRIVRLRSSVIASSRTMCVTTVNLISLRKR